MKKRLITIAIILIMVIVNAAVVQADTLPTVTIKTSSTEVKPGETLTVTLSVKCDNGINGFDATYSYDDSILELQSGAVTDTTKWSSLGSGNSITIICNSSEKITNSDIYVLTFKVKENATIGSKATINFENITVDMDVATNSNVTIDGQTATIKIAQTTNNGDTTTGDNSNNGNNNNSGNNGTNNDGTNNNGTNNNGTNNNGTNNNNGSTTNNNNSSNTNNGKITTDKTVSKDTKLPQTGTGEMLVAVTIGIGSAIAIISYIGYRRHKNI